MNRNNPFVEGAPRILGVFAHPDDETFCAGGTFAKYIASGAEVMVVSATHGEAGQIRSPRVATRRTLAAVREQELHLACQRLGVQHARCLEYVDGTLSSVDAEELTGRVVKIIRSFRPDVVIPFGPDGGYGHPDHMAISAATTAACQRSGKSRPVSRAACGRIASTPTSVSYTFGGCCSSSWRFQWARVALAS